VRRLLPIALRLAILLALAGILAGCPQAVAASAPALDCGIAIVEDAVMGLTLAEIAAKEKTRCDADLAAIAAALLESRDPRLAPTRALGEARAQASRP
jgi:hypothetical protein